MSFDYRLIGSRRCLLATIPALAIFGAPDVAHAICTNLSLTDCNPAGETLNASAAFVDPSPPMGYDQCAGFINTASNDVTAHWENNCIEFNQGDMWLRVYDDATGELIAGAHMFDPVQCMFGYASQYSYATDSQEADGILGHAGSCTWSELTVSWFPGNENFCGCGGPSCNDIYGASSSDTSIFYVGGDGADGMEAMWAEGYSQGACPFGGENYAVRVAIYVPTQDPDVDDDGVLNIDDNCDYDVNPGQEDEDGDLAGDACDNCLGLANGNQLNNDNDAFGNACDNCDNAVNDGQEDNDTDTLGNACDNCPDASNVGQQDMDGDSLGDACDACPGDQLNDPDGDAICGDV
ncbi:MAG TPA: hypothetical protein VG755_17260, partial [Nannocystaceae bacterium]|nr:hypothetical protein [Nannocystaceae bacterium]